MTARRAAAALTLLLLAAGCAPGSRGDPRGTALATSGSTEVGAKVIPPGARIGFLAVGLDNTSHHPVTLRSVVIRGPGIGSVVRVTQLDLVSGLPGMLYSTDPPALDLSGGCVTGRLIPVRGYRIAPGADHGAWLWEVFQAIRPGRWSVPAHPVTYTQDGMTYQEVLGQGDYGTVSLHAKAPQPTSLEAPCLRHTHRLDPGR